MEGDTDTRLPKPKRATSAQVGNTHRLKQRNKLLRVQGGRANRPPAGLGDEAARTAGRRHFRASSSTLATMAPMPSWMWCSSVSHMKAGVVTTLFFWSTCAS